MGLVGARRLTDFATKIAHVLPMMFQQFPMFYLTSHRLLEKRRGGELPPFDFSSKLVGQVHLNARHAYSIHTYARWTSRKWVALSVNRAPRA
jgi:hypothetical protein